jgi:osmoprotectant transport system ATP-binding protein
MSDPLVQFDHVGFAHTAGAPILHDVTLACLPGHTTAIVGRSGAGKSTLLKLVNRLFLPTSGVVWVQGRDTREWDPIRLRRSAGYVMQDAGLFPHMTVEENVGVVPRLEGWDDQRVRARSRDLLELVGLPVAQYGSRRPAELSGGQRQRVGLARALAIDPPMLLLDEPFGALDPITRREMRVEFARLRRQLGTTALLVTHDIAEALALGDQIGVMDAGALIARGSPDQLAQHADPRVRSLLDTGLPDATPTRSGPS